MLLRGAPEPAVYLRDEGCPVLVAPLVVAYPPELRFGEAVQPRGDLLYVHLVVAVDRRLPCDAFCGGPRHARYGAHHVVGDLGNSARPLLGTSCGPLGALPILGESGVE